MFNISLLLTFSSRIRKPQDPDLRFPVPEIFLKRNIFMSYTPGRQGLCDVSRARTRQQCEFSRFVYSFAVVHFRKVSDSVKARSGGNRYPVI